MHQDEFTGVTTARFWTQPLIEQGDHVRLADGDRFTIGRIPSGGGLFVHHTRADRWVYLRCHSFYLLVDGERMPVPEPEHQGEVTERGVIESVSVLNVDDTTLRRMRNMLDRISERVHVPCMEVRGMATTVEARCAGLRLVVRRFGEHRTVALLDEETDELYAFNDGDWQDAVESFGRAA